MNLREVLQEKSAAHPSVIGEILASPDIRDQFVLKLTYHSNKIEGSTLSEPETAAIIFDNVALPDRTLVEQLEAKNHQTALLAMFDRVSSKAAIDEKFILKLHGILMNGIRPDAGVYRSHAVRIVGVDLPTANYLKIPDLMPELFAEISAKAEDIINLAAKIHARFEQIHPFSDGNGRVGRLLMNTMFLVANLAPAIIRAEEKRQYYDHLYQAQTKEEFTPLADFFATSILEGFQILDRTDRQ